MSMRKFTEQEVENAVYERTVYSTMGELHRWSAPVESIVEQDGKLYRINWMKGLTENQEDFFESGEYPEVYREDNIVVSVEKNFKDVSSETVSRKDSLTTHVNDLKIVGDVDTITNELNDLNETDIDKLRKAVDSIDLLNVDRQMELNHAVVKRYLDELDTVIKSMKS